MAGHVQGAYHGVGEVEVEDLAAVQALLHFEVLLLLNGVGIGIPGGGDCASELLELGNGANVVPVAVGNQDAGQADCAGFEGIKVFFLLHDAHAAVLGIGEFQLRAVLK